MKRDINLEVPIELREAEAVLERYGRWAQDRYRKQRCASAEGKYQPPPIPGCRDDEPLTPFIPDWSAMQVQHGPRAVWHMAYQQPIPAGHRVFLMCDEPACCNPKHMKCLSEASYAAHLKRTDDRRAMPLCCARPGVEGCHAAFDQYRLVPGGRAAHIELGRAMSERTRQQINESGRWPKKIPQLSVEAA